MKSYQVRDIMVPLDEYATLHQDAALNEAESHLRNLKNSAAADPNIHRSLLVVDDDGRVVGKLSQLDLILGLEEGYRRIGDMKALAHFGYDPKFIRSMIENNQMWQKPLDEICEKADRIRVKDIMYTPTRGEYVDADASLDIAIHQLGMGRHHALLVTEKNRVVGVLRLSDIFDVVDAAVKDCSFKTSSIAA